LSSIQLGYGLVADHSQAFDTVRSFGTVSAKPFRHDEVFFMSGSLDKT
jgi:hypothetical protein